VRIADEKYVVLATCPPVGDPVTTRARLVPLSDGRLGLWPAADVVSDGETVSLRRGGPDAPGSAGSPVVTGTAAVVRSGRGFEETRAKLRRKYGWRARLSRTDALVVVRLDGS
jgi:hypothetical protein